MSLAPSQMSMPTHCRLEALGGDGRRGAAAEGIEHEIAGVAAGADDPLV